MSLKLFDLFRRLTTSDITNGYGSGYDQVRIRLVLKRKDSDLPTATARFDLCHNEITRESYAPISIHTAYLHHKDQSCQFAT